MLSSGVSSLHGVTRSPWDPHLTTGGSSSGAGAAAAGGYGPLHVGTDIGGSIRPAPGRGWADDAQAECGPRPPRRPPYSGRAAGPMARSAVDAAMLLDGHQRTRRPGLDRPPGGAARPRRPHRRRHLRRRGPAGRPARRRRAGSPWTRRSARRSKKPLGSSRRPARLVEQQGQFLAPALPSARRVLEVRSLVDFDALEPAAGRCSPSSGGGSRRRAG